MSATFAGLDERRAASRGLQATHRHDEDEFDRVWEHLVVTDEATGEVVGTYRMQAGNMAARNNCPPFLEPLRQAIPQSHTPLRNTSGARARAQRTRPHAPAWPSFNSAAAPKVLT
jgi:hypothetical protein